MLVHVIDGTYELFRAYFGAPSAKNARGREVGATRGFLRSMAALLREPAVTHVGCAFDHTIESFRNDLFPGYKTGEGLDPLLLDQFELVEEASRALGMVTWPMIEFEADDALASAAERASTDERVEQVVIASPDKDLTQCVRGQKIVCWDRMRKKVLDEAAVVKKCGVLPESVPDLLALVGDDADGIPGIPRWGEKSAAAVLSRYRRIDDIPDDHRLWDVAVRGAQALAQSLASHRTEAQLYKRLATLRRDVPVFEHVDELAWRGARRDMLEALCAEIGEDGLVSRVERFQ